MSLQDPPSRDEVEKRWRAVAAGEVTRESVSKWAEPLMFADFATQPDPMAMSALQNLHGFDMTYRSEDRRLIGHGAPGPYVHDSQHIKTSLVRWLSRCIEYDEDPVTFMAARRREALEAVERERRERA